MWSIGIPNSFELSIPTLGLDDMHYCAAASAAADHKGAELCNKKLQKQTGKIDYGTFKPPVGFAKKPGPFSISQLKEIGASLAKNCSRWQFFYFYF
jgi:hypothetical protein